MTQPPKPVNPTGGAAAPQASRPVEPHSSTKTKRIAKSFVFPPLTAIEESLSDVRNEINLIHDTKEAIQLVAVTASTVAKRQFESGEAYIVSALESGLFSIFSFFVKGASLGVSIQKTNEVWRYCSFEEKIARLGEVALNTLTFGNTTLGIAKRIASYVAVSILAVPIAFLSTIYMTLLTLKFLYNAVRLQQSKGALLEALKGKQGEERLRAGLAYCTQIKTNIDAENAELARPAEQEKERFKKYLEAREKWAVASLLGSSTHKGAYAAGLKMSQELNEIEAMPDSPQKNRLKAKLLIEGEQWLAQLVKQISDERSTQAAYCLSLLIGATVGILSTIALFTTIQYWGPVMLALGVLSTVIGLAMDLYAIWASHRKGKEKIADEIATGLASAMKTMDSVNQEELAARFMYDVDSTLAPERLMADFERHLKLVFREKRILPIIDRSLMNVIANQRCSLEKISVKEVQKFSREMEIFLERIRLDKKAEEKQEAEVAHRIRSKAFAVDDFTSLVSDELFGFFHKVQVA